jgi:Protein of unknown function (DUF1003)
MNVIGCRPHSMRNEGGREDDTEAAREARKSTCDLRSHPAGAILSPRRAGEPEGGTSSPCLDVRTGGRVGRAVLRHPAVHRGQSFLVVVWIVLNSLALLRHWDPYPFILLNLAFSTQAAYAAPLILFAQTRQAERDKAALEKADSHRDEFMERMQRGEDTIRRDLAEIKTLLGR